MQRIVFAQIVCGIFDGLRPNDHVEVVGFIAVPDNRILRVFQVVEYEWMLCGDITFADKYRIVAVKAWFDIKMYSYATVATIYGLLCC